MVRRHPAAWTLAKEVRPGIHWTDWRSLFVAPLPSNSMVGVAPRLEMPRRLSRQIQRGSGKLLPSRSRAGRCSRVRLK